MSPTHVALRILGGFALAAGPYVAHVAPLLFGHPVLFNSLLTAAATFAICGVLAGLLCSYWAMAFATVALLPDYLVMRATGFLEARDTLMFLIVAIAFTVVFSIPAAFTSALMLRPSRVDPGGDAG